MRYLVGPVFSGVLVLGAAAAAQGSPVVAQAGPAAEAAHAASARYATSTVHRDDTGDLLTTEDIDFIPVPDAVNGDIQTVRLAYRHDRIQMFMTVRAMNLTDDTFPDFYDFDVINGKGKTVLLSLDRLHGVEVKILRKGSSHPYRCAWVHHKVNTTTLTAAITIPRSCLDNPKYVRIRARSHSSDVVNGKTRFLEDYGYLGTGDDPYGGREGRSPWVRRG